MKIDDIMTFDIKTHLDMRGYHLMGINEYIPYHTFITSYEHSGHTLY